MISTMTREEAEKWLLELKEHIAKQHPHLKDRELQWAEWKRLREEKSP